MKQSKLNSLIAKINSPYNTNITSWSMADRIVDTFQDTRYLGQVTSFFTEIPYADQLEFVQHHDIDEAALIFAGKEFASYTGMSVCQ